MKTKKSVPTLFGTDLFGEPIRQASAQTHSLLRNFVMNPFSVLNTNLGPWRSRRRAWLSFGIQGELGREGTDGVHKAMRKSIIENKVYKRNRNSHNDISVFDPVLCELAYRWFCPPGGQVVDPFAGGSVRGLVATLLDLKYWGSDLNEGQLVENRRQAKKISPDNLPVWVHGDSVETIRTAPSADLVFSCPPYGNLEEYSNDPKDLSNKQWEDFWPSYHKIIVRACKRLKPDRFACFVVGNFRDKRTGYYCDFVGKTIEAFQAGGCGFYNDAVLLTSLTTSGIRANGMFSKSRKLVKSHQNVLVFCKGNWKEASVACSAVADPLIIDHDGTTKRVGEKRTTKE